MLPGAEPSLSVANAEAEDEYLPVEQGAGPRIPEAKSFISGTEKEAIRSAKNQAWNRVTTWEGECYKTYPDAKILKGDADWGVPFCELTEASQARLRRNESGAEPRFICEISGQVRCTYQRKNPRYEAAQRALKQWRHAKAQWKQATQDYERCEKRRARRKSCVVECVEEAQRRPGTEVAQQAPTDAGPSAITSSGQVRDANSRAESLEERSPTTASRSDRVRAVDGQNEDKLAEQQRQAKAYYEAKAKKDLEAKQRIAEQKRQAKAYYDAKAEKDTETVRKIAEQQRQTEARMEELGEEAGRVAAAYLANSGGCGEVCAAVLAVTLTYGPIVAGTTMLATADPPRSRSLGIADPMTMGAGQVLSYGFWGLSAFMTGGMFLDKSSDMWEVGTWLALNGGLLGLITITEAPAVAETAREVFASQPEYRDEMELVIGNAQGRFTLFGITSLVLMTTGTAMIIADVVDDGEVIAAQKAEAPLRILPSTNGVVFRWSF